MLVRQQPAQLLVIHEFGQELPRDVRRKQPIAVLREYRRHPYRLVNAKSDEPAVQQVVIELFHQLPLRPDRIECLQQKRPQQPLRCDRRPSAVRVSLGKIAVERRQNLVHHTRTSATGASQEPASQGQRKKTVRLSAHLSRASVPPEIADTTNHIRNRLSGGFFSSLLELAVGLAAECGKKRRATPGAGPLPARHMEVIQICH